ncbi:MinD/ParA family ATP-binding protein [Salinibaculum rarum]|uniref:MinD/ParA family ATP-binding protein n=1 Tax=Salinibaculum rarum TaxID=3058903 RepID=UPI0026600D31|nr:P-loop NTPase [Salinibaculum sp. KK48]
MAGYVCTIAGGKGGVGKTTTAVNVAAAMEANGYDTVVVDADLGMANLGEMLGIDHDRSIHEILAGDATVTDALTDVQGGVTTIAGEQSLEAFADADPAKLRKVIKTLRVAYDVVLVDTGAGLSHETTVPLGLADGILLVTTPDDVAVADTVKTAQLAERVDGTIIGGLVCRVTHDTDVEGIADDFEFPLLGVIPADSDATASEPLVFNAADSVAADAYRQLAAVLQDIFFEDVPPSDADLVVDEEWFVDDEEDVEEESSGGRFGFFG